MPDELIAPLLSLLAVFIMHPWLALAPAAAFGLLFRASRRRAALAVALAWGVYAVYEAAMKAHILCSGECDIRVDLLLIYPVLVLASVVAIIQGARALWRRRIS